MRAFAIALLALTREALADKPVAAPAGGCASAPAKGRGDLGVIDTTRFETLATIAADAPSGIFFTARAARIGL